MRIFQVMGLLLALGSSYFADPAFPPNAVGGGTVVAELQIEAGHAKQISIRSGEEPFVSSSRSALEQWRLDDENDGNTLAIVYFRHPNLYYLQEGAETIGGAGANRSLPYPKSIVGPSYPAQMLAQGSVVLRMEVRADGSPGRIEALKSPGALTDVSIESVRKWKFLAAEDSRGKAIPSHVYVVFVYRFPVTQQKR